MFRNEAFKRCVAAPSEGVGSIQSIWPCGKSRNGTPRIFFTTPEKNCIPYLITWLKLAQVRSYRALLNGCLCGGGEGPACGYTRAILLCPHTKKPHRGKNTVSVSVHALPEPSGIHRRFHRNLPTHSSLLCRRSRYRRKQLQLLRSFVVPLQGISTCVFFSTVKSYQ